MKAITPLLQLPRLSNKTRARSMHHTALQLLLIIAQRRSPSPWGYKLLPPSMPHLKFVGHIMSYSFSNSWASVAGGQSITRESERRAVFEAVANTMKMPLSLFID